MGTLYVIATPIGNLKDITLRALRILGQVGLIAAEDTRTTRKLLAHYDIRAPLTSYNDHNMRAKIPLLLRKLEEADLGLVSEAGTPTINDPGRELIAACIDKGVPVVSVPGASVIPTALAASGLPTDRFLYLGFLPRRRRDRLQLLEGLRAESSTLVALEAPHRLRGSLEDIQSAFSDRRLSICRELTKLHKEVFRGTATQAIDYFVEPRGEFTLVIEGSAEPEPEVERNEKLARVRELLEVESRRGVTSRDAIRRAVESTGLPRREVYRAWLDLKKGTQG